MAIFVSDDGFDTVLVAPLQIKLTAAMSEGPTVPPMVTLVPVIAVTPPVPTRVKANCPAANPLSGAEEFTELSVHEDIVTVLTAYALIGRSRKAKSNMSA